MDRAVELEICGNCKKEIPHYNYVMHTAHCARRITLCTTCKEPIPKDQIEQHRKCHKSQNINEKFDFPKSMSTTSHSPKGNTSNTFSNVNHTPEHKPPHENDTKKLSKQNSKYSEVETTRERDDSEQAAAARYVPKPKSKSKPSLIACTYCDLELPKSELENHENYCGSRTDKCNECGELVMFKYKKLHEDMNHGFLKLNDEPGPKSSWDSDTQRVPDTLNIRRQRFEPIYTVDSFDFSPLYNSFSSSSIESNNGEKRESYKDLSRRLDCKTEYIRNLLHDSANITVPLRRNGTTPRNHFNHNKGPAPQPPSRRANPPTQLTIPCEFCDTPIPHEDLIQHETGCRPDLARLSLRRRSPSPDDYFTAPAPSSPEVQLPCEFCADMFPASELLRHQATCI